MKRLIPVLLLVGSLSASNIHVSGSGNLKACKECSDCKTSANIVVSGNGQMQFQRTQHRQRGEHDPNVNRDTSEKWYDRLWRSIFGG